MADPKIIDRPSSDEMKFYVGAIADILHGMTLETAIKVLGIVFGEMVSGLSAGLRFRIFNDFAAISAKMSALCEQDGSRAAVSLDEFKARAEREAAHPSRKVH